MKHDFSSPNTNPTKITSQNIREFPQCMCTCAYEHMSHHAVYDAWNLHVHTDIRHSIIFALLTVHSLQTISLLIAKSRPLPASAPLCYQLLELLG